MPILHQLEIRDKNGTPLKEGNYVLQYRSCKGIHEPEYPSYIRYVCQVSWSKHQAGYVLEDIGILEEDATFDCEVGHDVVPLFEVSRVVGSDNYRNDMICELVEKVKLENIDMVSLAWADRLK